MLEKNIDYKVKDYINKWYVIDEFQDWALLENTTYGDETCYLVVRKDVPVVEKNFINRRTGEKIKLPEIQKVICETYDDIQTALDDEGIEYDEDDMSYQDSKKMKDSLEETLKNLADKNGLVVNFDGKQAIFTISKENQGLLTEREQYQSLMDFYKENKDVLKSAGKDVEVFKPDPFDMLVRVIFPYELKDSIKDSKREQLTKEIGILEDLEKTNGWSKENAKRLEKLYGEVYEILKAENGAEEDKKADEVEAPSAMEDSDDKYVIYKEDGHWKGTSLSNYNAKNRDEYDVMNFEDFNTADEVAEYVVEQLHINEDDILIEA